LINSSKQYAEGYVTRSVLNPGLHFRPHGNKEVSVSFKIGEKVVYPNHGIGVIEKITTTEIAGTQSSFYLLRLKATESTVMVPIANASEIGLRAPINNNQCDKLLKALSEDFTNPPVDWKDRYKEFLEKMKTGDIFHVAEVLKNLTYLSLNKPLSFREKRMLERARYLVISELSTVCRKSECVVEPMVDDALNRSCSKHRASGVARPIAARAMTKATAIAH
jgi:CarD family transcriptional regulator